MSVITGPQGNADTAKNSDEPSAADWLPQAHFGRVIGAPSPPVGRDDEPDPDDEEVHPAPPDVVWMLGFDPLELNSSNFGTDEPFPEDKEPDGANPTPAA